MNAANAHKIATMAMNGSPGFTGALGLAPDFPILDGGERPEPVR